MTRNIVNIIKILLKITYNFQHWYFDEKMRWERIKQIIEYPSSMIFQPTPSLKITQVFGLSLL